MTYAFSIAGRTIGQDAPPYIIAELSGNHNGDLGRAFQLMEAAKNAGADAIKIQTYTADTLTIDCDKLDFKITGGAWDGRTLYDLYQEAHTPWQWHPALFAKAKELGITMFSTPFDYTSIDFLENLDVPAYKIASFENIDLPLIARIAQTRKPIIMSTGMANDTEIGEAVAAARDAGCQDLCLLHCVSGYPAAPEQSNLKTLVDIQKRFGVISGLSDHTLTNATSVAAVALGASVIEKHVTLARADGGPDAGFSLEPHELAKLVQDCKTAHAALGAVTYEQAACEKPNMVFRRSLYAVKNIGVGETFTNDNVRSIRPGYGLPPKHLPDVLGKRATCNISRGTPLRMEFFQ